jgi:hypothetical protein
MSMGGRTIERDQLGDIQKIAAGGQGTVYTAPKVRLDLTNEAVYKEYKPGIRVDVAVLQRMVDFLWSLTYAQGIELVARSAWPVSLVVHRGAVSGFIMPRIPAHFTMPLRRPSGIVSQVRGELQHLLNDDRFLKGRGIVIEDAARYAILNDMARGLELFHSHGIVVGDLSPKNVLFSLSSERRTYFIDCDSARFRGESGAPQVETPDWMIREVSGEELATPATDRYKLGLMALRLFAQHQNARDPSQLPQRIPGEVRGLIVAALSPHPVARPAAGEWSPVLELAREKALAMPRQPKPVPPKPVPRSQPRVGPPRVGPARPPRPGTPPAPAPAPGGAVRLPSPTGTLTSRGAKLATWGGPTALFVGLLLMVRLLNNEPALPAQATAPAPPVAEREPAPEPDPDGADLPPDDGAATPALTPPPVDPVAEAERMLRDAAAAVRATPADAGRWLRLADRHVQRGDAAAAAGARAVAAWIGWAEAPAAGEPPDLARAIAGMRAVGITNARWVATLGDAALESERFGPAETLYRYALEIEPGSTEWRTRLGRVDDARTRLAERAAAVDDEVRTVASVVQRALATARTIRQGTDADAYLAAASVLRDAADSVAVRRTRIGDLPRLDSLTRLVGAELESIRIVCQREARIMQGRPGAPRCPGS